MRTDHTPQGNGEKSSSKMPVHEFVTGLEKKCEHRSGRIAGMEGTEEEVRFEVEPSKDKGDDFLYLKDWHFARCSVRLANRKCKQAEEDGEDGNPFTGHRNLGLCDDRSTGGATRCERNGRVERRRTNGAG